MTLPRRASFPPISPQLMRVRCLVHSRLVAHRRMLRDRQLTPVQLTSGSLSPILGAIKCHSNAHHDSEEPYALPEARVRPRRPEGLRNTAARRGYALRYVLLLNYTQNTNITPQSSPNPVNFGRNRGLRTTSRPLTPFFSLMQPSSSTLLINQRIIQLKG